MTTENKTAGTEGLTTTCYRLHVPLGREMACLPTRYECQGEAQQAFERTRGGVARWCLVAAHEPGSDEEAPLFVVRGTVDGDGVKWKSLLQGAEQIPSVVRPRVTIQEQRMTQLLTPQLGFFTAEEVVRHVCARFQSVDFAEEKQVAELREFLRRGLVGYMEPRVAEELAEKCAELS